MRSSGSRTEGSGWFCTASITCDHRRELGVAGRAGRGDQLVERQVAVLDGVQHHRPDAAHQLAHRRAAVHLEPDAERGEQRADHPLQLGLRPHRERCGDQLVAAPGVTVGERAEHREQQQHVQAGALGRGQPLRGVEQLSVNGAVHPVAGQAGVRRRAAVAGQVLLRLGAGELAAPVVQQP
jgi:hypothetical protein